MRGTDGAASGERFAVPVVDIAPWVDQAAHDDAARARVARQIDAACSSVGFVQVLGHGVPGTAVAGLASAIPTHLDARPWGGSADEAYGPVTVRDHIAAKLAGSRQGRVNVSAVRDAARVLASQG